MDRVETGDRFPGYSRGRVDDEIVNPDVYADEHEMHAMFTRLRQEARLHYMRPTGFRPFWSVTRHADVLEVERRSDVFVNRLRTYLSPIETERWIQSVAGDTHLFRTLVDLDDPDHIKLRQLTQGWFMPGNLKALEARIAGIARAHVDRMAELGGACDFVKEIAVWYPLRVIMEILGVPAEDEPFMLKLTQEIFGPGDPDVVDASERAASVETISDGDARMVDLAQTAQALFAYFGALTAERRANPRDDVASVIANGEIDGAPIGEREAMSYYVIIATAGHDTTSSVAAGGLLQLIRNPDQLARLRAEPALLASAVEEMIRWVTPVQHFMRTAVEDYELAGQRIRAGEALCLHYPSANRDEAAFEHPFAFRVDRQPNRQIAFGHGVHLCLGMHLARLELRALFQELLPRLQEVQLAGEPRRTRSVFVSGLKSLPIRYRMRA